MAEVVVDEMAGGLGAGGSPGLVGWAHKSEGVKYEEEMGIEVELQKDATSDRAWSEASHGPY